VKVIREFDYDAIKEFIRGSHPESIIMIGCDSVRKDVNGKAFATYATVVCVRKSSGAGVYHGSKLFSSLVKMPDYGKVIKSGKIANLKVRMMQEVTFALEAFGNLQDVLEDRIWEIHVDINSRSDCESHVALNDAKGYVMGVTGQEPMFKPIGLAASFAADAVAHGLIQ